MTRVPSTPVSLQRLSTYQLLAIHTLLVTRMLPLAMHMSLQAIHTFPVHRMFLLDMGTSPLDIATSALALEEFNMSAVTITDASLQHYIKKMYFLIILIKS